MKVNYGCSAIVIVAFIAPALGQGASLTASDVSLVAGEQGVVVVSGAVINLNTFGLTILVELVPREGSVGIVQFTPAPPVDVHQLDDPWADAGMYTAFDTNAAGFSSTLNGYVDDNGTFFCDAQLLYGGRLAGFPIIASGDAIGIWDVRLSTNFGDSSWECVPTALQHGTITIIRNIPAVSAWGLIILTLILATAGSVCIRRARHI